MLPYWPSLDKFYFVALDTKSCTSWGRFLCQFWRQRIFRTPSDLLLHLLYCNAAPHSWRSELFYSRRDDDEEITFTLQDLSCVWLMTWLFISIKGKYPFLNPYLPHKLCQQTMFFSPFSFHDQGTHNLCTFYYTHNFPLPFLFLSVCLWGYFYGFVFLAFVPKHKDEICFRTNNINWLLKSFSCWLSSWN